MAQVKILVPLSLLVLIWTGCDFGDDNSQPDCAIYPAQQTSPYVLPYGIGEAYFVGQTTNHGGVQKSAIDFVMPIGTQVVAVVARYIHLTQDGAVVEVGDRVAQGDTVGLSGDTGNSTEPHLHFDVSLCCCVNAGEYNELPCGLELGVTYMALP